MAIRIKAKQRLMKVGPNAGKKVWKLTPDIGNKIVFDKLCKRAAERNNLSATIIKAAIGAVAESIKDYLVIGDSVELGELGTLRLSMRAKTSENLADVNVNNIERRRLVFTPSKEIKEFINAEPVEIVYFDEKGKKVRRVDATTK